MLKQPILNLVLLLQVFIGFRATVLPLKVYLSVGCISYKLQAALVQP